MQIQFPGRSVLPAVVLSLTLFACHQADHPANTPVSRRMALIAALKELRGRILSGDKTQIGRIFSFPVPDSVFNPFFDDSLFQLQKEKNGNAITQQLFNTYFDKISGATELEGFKGLFSFIDPDSLQHKDSIDVDTVLDKEGSSRIYWIHIQDDSLIDINYGTGHCQTLDAEPKPAAANAVNDPPRTITDTARLTTDTASIVKDAIAPAADSVGSEDDTDETDASACEHTTFWYFSFDGKNLHLVRQGSAD